MSTSGFLATLLRTSAEGFAGLAASRLMEGDPTLAGPAGFEAWRAHMRNQLGALAAAVEGDPLPGSLACSLRTSSVSRVRETRTHGLNGGLR